jgi:predicted RNase H-like HicB family nuclease
MRIGVYSQGATRDELKQAIDALWRIESAQQVGALLP